MKTLEDLRSVYTEVEKIRRPSVEASPFMEEYLDRKGEICNALEANLDIPEGSILDEMPPETEIPQEVLARVQELEKWLEVQNFRKIPQEVLEQVRRLEEGFQTL